MRKISQRKPPHRSRDFLRWAKTQMSVCCLCREKPGSQLHHLEPGLGKKGSDLLVCRVCPECHQWAEGKRRIALERMDKLGEWTDMLVDSLKLLSEYTAKLELAKKHSGVIF
jgi:hypothetical protein